MVCSHNRSKQSDEAVTGFELHLLKQTGAPAGLAVSVRSTAGGIEGPMFLQLPYYPIRFSNLERETGCRLLTAAIPLVLVGRPASSAEANSGLWNGTNLRSVLSRYDPGAEKTSCQQTRIVSRHSESEDRSTQLRSAISSKFDLFFANFSE